MRLLEGSDHALSDFDAASADVLAFLRPAPDSARRRCAAARRVAWDNRAPCYALFEDAGKFLAGRVMSRGRRLGAGRARLRQARQGQGRQRRCCASRSRRPPSCCAEAQRAGRASIDLDLAWEFAPEERVRLRRPGARLLRRQGRRWRSRRRRCCACSRRRTTSAALGKGRFRKAPAEIVKAALARHRAQEAGRGADRRLGRRAGRRQLPGAGARAALQDPVQARQERARIQGGGRGRAAHAARAARPAEGAPARSTRPTSSTGGASCSRTSRKGTGFPAAGGAGRSRTTCRWPPVQAFSIDDSATTEIDDALSVQGLGSGTVAFGIHIAAPALALAPGGADRPGGARSACRPSTCRATS